MAISPPSDIVLDVARAADPAALQAARAQLSGRMVRAAAQGAFSLEAPAGPSQRPTPARLASQDPFQKFEAMVLQTFVETMLPDNATSIYGEGVAGDMWKSMMAEQLAGTMAARGGIGIAGGMLRDRYVEDEKIIPIGAVSDLTARLESDRQDRLSTALVQEMQRKLARSLAADRSSVAGGNGI